MSDPNGRDSFCSASGRIDGWLSGFNALQWVNHISYFFCFVYESHINIFKLESSNFSNFDKFLNILTFIEETEALVRLCTNIVSDTKARAALRIDQLGLAAAANTLASVHLDVRLGAT